MVKLIAKILVGVPFVLLLGLESFSLAATSPKALRLAYVDLSHIFDKYQHTVDAEKELELLKGEKQKEIDKKSAEIKEMKEALETLSKSGREEKQIVIDEKIKDLNELRKKIREELTKSRDGKAKEILKEIGDFIEKYGREKGYDMILNNRVLIYKDDSFDLSNEILKGLNEEYKKAKK